MLALDAATKSLEIKLAGAITTTELPFVAGFVELDQTLFALSASSETDGTTNGGTAVAVVAAPAAGRTRKLNYLSVFNVDTAVAVVTVQINNGGTKRISWKGTLAIGDTLTYVDERGFFVTDANGSLKTAAGLVALGGGVAGLLAPANGGTGVNNGLSTMTFGGSVAFSGAFTCAITVTANTTVTLPTSGTLVNSAVASLLSLTSVGTLTSGATGTGFTVALSTSTITGTLADARLSGNVPLLNAVALQTFTAGIAATTGAFSSTLTVTGASTLNTSVTMPVGGSSSVLIDAASNYNVVSLINSTSLSANVGLFGGAVGDTASLYFMANAGGQFDWRVNGTDLMTLSATMLSLTGTLSVTGAATVSSTLAVTGATTLTGALTANANSTINGTGGSDAQLTVTTTGTNPVGITLSNATAGLLAQLEATNVKGLALIVNAGNTFGLELASTGAWRGRFYGAGTATFDASGNLTSVSDPRMKDRIELLPYGLDEVMELRPVQHGYNEASGLEREHLYGGFLADDDPISGIAGVKRVMPLAVGMDMRGCLTLADRPILGAVVNSIQNHEGRLRALEGRPN